VTEDFTRHALMPLFFAIEPLNESDGRNEFEIPAAGPGCLCLCSPLTPSQPSSVTSC
jgi:hypothetical protein